MVARRLRHPGIMALSLLITGAFAPSAQAQWGWGWGGGWAPYYNSPGDPTDFLNSWSLNNANRAATNKPVNDPNFAYNAYYTRVRDTEFFQKYDARTRQEMENRVSRNPVPLPPVSTASRPSTTPRPAVSPPPVQTVVRLGGFFDKYSKLLWPADAPKTPELLPSRDAADASALEVLQEYNERGLATVSLTTEARQKLVAYGQPALAYIREHASAPIADAFHIFLLSLYNEIGQAAKIRKQ